MSLVAPPSRRPTIRQSERPPSRPTSRQASVEPPGRRRYKWAPPSRRQERGAEEACSAAFQAA
ncbi:MAG TPA: hypothetical protein VH599_10840, partial [Ktedonobacterales bacterium]